MNIIESLISNFTLEGIITFLVFLTIVITLAYPIIRYCTSHINDNEMALANWLFGYYGNVKVGPRAVFRLPGSEFTIHNTEPRKDKAVIEKVFKSEPDPGESGFTIEATLSFILSLNKDTDCEGFKEFHRIQESLENGAFVYIEAWIDNQIRNYRGNGEIENPKNIKNVQDQVEESARTELQRHIDDLSKKSVVIFDFGLKLDLEQDVRDAMKRSGIQELDNKAYAAKFKEIKKITAELVGDDIKLPNQLAVLIALKIAKEPGVDLSKQILDIQGLENFRGLIDTHAIEKIAQMATNFSENKRGDK